MGYLFYLSGENLKLALAELKALFEAYSLKFRITKRDRLVLLEARASEAQIRRLATRSALLKLAFSLISASKRLDLAQFKKIKWEDFVFSPFCVRILNLTGKKLKITEAELGALIWKSLKRPAVDLVNPKTTIYVIVTKGAVYVVKLLFRAEKGRFKLREPSKKPAFHPTSLKPLLARLLVNLARAREGEILLDPFCGMSSIPIEAGIISCRIAGSDLDERMISGSRVNLEFYKNLFKYKKYRLIKANALELEKHFKKNSISAIATDPPYGRSAKIGAKSLEELYSGFLRSAHKILKPGRFVCLIYPHYIKVLPLVSKKDWKIVDEQSLYVHGGLTRKILVLQKL